MPNILVIDDEPDIVLMIRLSLRSLGHTCLHAETGEQGLDVLAAGSVDAVLLDIRLPGIDGWEVLRRVKADPTLRQVKMIVMSAHSSAASLAQARDLGCDAYLTKPFGLERLQQIVADTIGG